MVESALNVVAETVLELSAYGVALSRDGNHGPVSVPQGVYPCRPAKGRERWIAIAVQEDAEWQALNELMGRPGWACALASADATRRRELEDAIDTGVRAWTADHDVDDLADALRGRGVPAAVVTAACDVVDSPQARARGFVEAFDHAVLGRHELLGIPFRFASHDGPWFRSPSPTLGEHNRTVLQGLLGVPDDEYAKLEQDAVVGTVPLGL